MKESTCICITVMIEIIMAVVYNNKDYLNFSLDFQSLFKVFQNH